MQKIRCPQCANIVAAVEGDRITARVAVRGRARREIVAFDRAEFACDHCGHRWLYVCVPPAPEIQRTPAMAGAQPHSMRAGA